MIFLIIGIVQARMDSERLPGKVMKKLLGLPMITVVLKRLKQARYIEKVVMATTDLPEDDLLAYRMKSDGFEIFRGDGSNVLKRYMDCVDKFGGDTIVRVTGDCPLVDPIIVDQVIAHHLTYGLDYTRLDVPGTFIRGFDVEVISIKALKKVYRLAHQPKYTEHVTSWIYLHPQDFSIGIVKGEALYQKPYRVCVDTLADFKVVEAIFANFGHPFMQALDVVRFLEKHPEIAKLNSAVEQKVL